MEVSVENQSGVPVELSELAGLAEFVLRSEKAREDTDISVALVDEEEMRTLNRRFRRIDKATDVLAFDLSESDKEFYGEVVISPQVAAGQAKDAGIEGSEEIHHLLIHGLLHLLGYSHELESDADEMFDRQEKLRRDWTAAKGAPA